MVASEVGPKILLRNLYRHLVRDCMTRKRMPEVRGHTYGEQHQAEDTVVASEIEALADREGFVKFAPGPA